VSYAPRFLTDRAILAFVRVVEVGKPCYQTGHAMVLQEWNVVYSGCINCGIVKWLLFDRPLNVSGSY